MSNQNEETLAAIGDPNAETSAEGAPTPVVTRTGTQANEEQQSGGVGSDRTDAQRNAASGSTFGTPLNPREPAEFLMTSSSSIMEQLAISIRTMTELRTELAKLREDCANEFRAVNDRINRSRQNERDLANEQRRSSAAGRAMPGLMPTDVKAAKMQNFSSTKIDENQRQLMNISEKWRKMCVSVGKSGKSAKLCQNL